jgi:hypothetical protein
MKTIYLDRVLLIIYINLSAYQAYSQDISGYWQGVLYQQSGVPVSYFPFSMEIIQNDSMVYGISEIRQYNALQYYGIMMFEGEFSDSILMYQELEIIEEQTNGSWYWCIKNANLQYSSNSNSLIGPWQAPTCNPGTIEVYRISTTDTLFCQGDEIEIEVTGQNINWYNNSNMDSLLWSGNTFTPDIDTTTIYYVTQTHYETESPAVPVVVRVENCTSINQPEIIQKEAYTYPNPTTSGQVNIILPNTEITQLRILDLTGRVVHAEFVVSEYRVKLNTHSFPSGLLLIQLMDETGSIMATGKFVNQK